MPAADTKTQQLLYALGHRGASTAAANGCCNTKTQGYILDAITRITNEEDARADGDTNLQNQINTINNTTLPDNYATIQYVDTQVGDIETILATLTTGTGTGD